MYNVQLSNLLIFREGSIYHVYTEFISKNIFNLLRDVRKQWYVSLRISINYLDSRENKTNCFPREHTFSVAIAICNFSTMNFNDQFASLNIRLKKKLHSFRESFVIRVKYLQFLNGRYNDLYIQM